MVAFPIPSGQLSILTIYAAIWIFISVAWWAVKGERFGITGLPLYAMWRTTRLNNWIKRIAETSRTAWRVVWNLGVATGFGLMSYITYQLARNLVKLFVKSPQAASIQPIVPVPGIGVSYETFPYLVLALSVVVITHELSHGIASLVDQVPLKSTGAFFAHVLMGGFVEPNEEELSKSKNITKLRVFAAGSYANVVLGVFFTLLLVNFSATITPFYNVVQSGVSIGSIAPKLPANSTGLRAGDVLTSINGTSISGIDDLRNYMNRVKPGQVVVLETNRGPFSVRTAPDSANATHALIGIGGLTDNIVYQPRFAPLPSELPPVLFHAEFWLSIVLVSVAMINMLPVYPFDGDKFLETTLNAVGIKRTREIRTAANAVAYGLLLLNIGFSWLQFGFMRL
jgi:membrane-associated protease RseP (regulator of RpoE activity)